MYASYSSTKNEIKTAVREIEFFAKLCHSSIAPTVIPRDEISRPIVSRLVRVGHTQQKTGAVESISSISPLSPCKDRFDCQSELIFLDRGVSPQK